MARGRWFVCMLAGRSLLGATVQPRGAKLGWPWVYDSRGPPQRQVKRRRLLAPIPHSHAAPGKGSHNPGWAARRAASISGRLCDLAHPRSLSQDSPQFTIWCLKVIRGGTGVKQENRKKSECVDTFGRARSRRARNGRAGEERGGGGQDCLSLSPSLPLRERGPYPLLSTEHFFSPLLGPLPSPRACRDLE
jgi:hypothetical protein